jgi:molybdenum storage protein
MQDEFGYIDKAAEALMVDALGSAAEAFRPESHGNLAGRVRRSGLFETAFISLGDVFDDIGGYGQQADGAHRAGGRGRTNFGMRTSVAPLVTFEHSTLLFREAVPMSQRKELETRLRGETLVRKGLMRKREGINPLRLLPDLNVIKIGGHGIVDYGREVVLPLLEEIGELSKQHKILVVTGGGVRVRHIMDIGIDLGMPTGVLAELASKISEQNAVMVTLLLSRWGGSRVKTSDLPDLPTLFQLGLLPVIHGTPPYGLYEHPPEFGSIPPHRTDTGAFLIAELLGAKNCILVKNVDGLFDEDPWLNPSARMIEEIGADELIRMDMEDLILERKTVELLRQAANVRKIKIVNGHRRGTLAQALAEEKVGTILTA